MSSPPLTFDALLAGHDLSYPAPITPWLPIRCSCGEWEVQGPTFALMEHRKHLAAVLLAHVREAHEGLLSESGHYVKGHDGPRFVIEAADLRALTEETR